MPQRPLLDTEFSQRFFSDISDLYPGSARRYDCPGISDIHYCQLGVLRCLSAATTGQQFLQHHADHDVADIEPGHFFKALKSERRLQNITSLNDLLARPMRQRIPDPYAQCPELSDWELYAADGHYQHAASFDPKTKDSKGNPRSIATGHFFRLNLRTHHLHSRSQTNSRLFLHWGIRRVGWGHEPQALDRAVGRIGGKTGDTTAFDSVPFRPSELQATPPELVLYRAQAPGAFTGGRLTSLRSIHAKCDSLLRKSFFWSFQSRKPVSSP